MEIIKYENENSGVRIAMIAVDSISIIFKSSNKVYTYYGKNIGIENLQSLHTLARKRQGLNRKLNQIRKEYKAKNGGDEPTDN